MTRWARSGSSQKHKKPPEDPTPWEEFLQQKELKTKTIKGIQNLSSTSKQSKTVPTNASIEKESSKHNIRPSKKLLKNVKLKVNELKFTNISFSPEVNETQECDNNDKNIPVQDNIASCFQKKAEKVKRLKKNKKMLDILEVKIAHNVDVCSNTEKSDSDIEECKTDKVIKNEKLKIEKTTHDSTHEKEEDCDNKNSDGESPKTPPTFTKPKKKKYLDRLKEKRAKKGILLLSPKTEKMLYKMKKGLRKKGVPGEKIKEIIRQVRRKEELKFRKTLKTCYKCRQVGHVMSECPLINADSEEGTGICFKCGSTEHTSYKCSLKTSDFPFAKCFICKEQGHLSRVCPKNKHGAYPKGGKCNLCGSINHLKKDCPSLKKNDEEEEVTVGMMTAMTSVDEIDDAENYKCIPKKIKAVKF